MPPPGSAPERRTSSRRASNRRHVDVDVGRRAETPATGAVSSSRIGHRASLASLPTVGCLPVRVGLSLLTLVPGISGGSETYARELARALGTRRRARVRRARAAARARRGRRAPDGRRDRVPGIADDGRAAAGDGRGDARGRPPRGRFARRRRRPLPAHGPRAARRPAARDHAARRPASRPARAVLPRRAAVPEARVRPGGRQRPR